MRVAVVGATGYVGSALVPELVRAGIDTSAVVRAPSTLPAGVERVPVDDVSDLEIDWSTILRDADAIVYLAGLAHDVRGARDLEAYVRVNASTPLRVARRAADAGVSRFLFFSSTKVLGGHTAAGERFREDAPLKPEGTYATSKALAEEWLLEEFASDSGFVSILRPPLVVGPTPKGNLALLERAIHRGLPLPFASPRIGRRSYLGLRSLVDLVMVVLASDSVPPLLHARSDQELNVAELCEEIAVGVGRPARLVNVSPGILSGGARAVGRQELFEKLCLPMLISDERSRASLGWRPVRSRGMEFRGGV